MNGARRIPVATCAQADSLQDIDVEENDCEELIAMRPDVSWRISSLNDAPWRLIQ